MIQNYNEAEMSFKEKVVFFLNTRWKAGAAFLGLLVIVMAAVLIWNFIDNQKVVASAMAAENINDAFQVWMREKPEERSDEELNTLINNALTEFPRHFASQRALFTRGMMALQKEEWAGAHDAFVSLADKWPESYLAPVSLANAAGAKEEADQLDEAVKCWEKLAGQYTESSPVIPEALLNIARLHEKSGNKAAAVEAYADLEARFPQSRMAKIAKTRLLLLE